MLEYVTDDCMSISSAQRINIGGLMLNGSTNNARWKVGRGKIEHFEEVFSARCYNYSRYRPYPIETVNIY